MKWLIIIIIAGFLYYRFVLVKGGKLIFWKFGEAHPKEAYSFFSGNDSFVIFDSKPPDGYRSTLPSDEWVGPFKLHVPSKNKFVTIYGQSPEYEIAQESFMRTFDE